MSKQTALVIIDVQSGVVDWSQPTSQGSDAVLDRINELLANARNADIPVIYVQHDGQEIDSPVHEGSSGWEIHPAIAPAVGELVIHKRSCDSFFQTPLQVELEALGITARSDSQS